MIRKLMVLFAFLIVIFTSFGYGWSFDSKHGNIELGDEPGFTYVKITTIGVATGLVSITPKDIYNGRDKKYRKKDGSFLLQGTGCVVSNEYVVTAAHVVHPAAVTLAEKQWNYYRMSPIRVVSRLIFITSDPSLGGIVKGGAAAAIYHLDIENDIAVLKFNAGNIFKPVNYSLSNTERSSRGRLLDMIAIDDAIAMVVRNRDKEGKWVWGFEVKYGHVISNRVVDVCKEELPWYNMHDFTIDLILNKGDSGSVVFAFRNGEPVIIGIARATNKSSAPFGFDQPQTCAVKDLRSYATRIDFVKKIVEAE